MSVFYAEAINFENEVIAKHYSLSSKLDLITPLEENLEKFLGEENSVSVEDFSIDRDWIYSINEKHQEFNLETLYSVDNRNKKKKIIMSIDSEGKILKKYTLKKITELNT